MSAETPHDSAEHAMRQANRAAKRGDLAAAERWSKTAERLAAAAERLQAIDAERAVAAQTEEYNDEECRAELQRRFALFTDASEENTAWENERNEYYDKLRDALENNTELPPPLRPSPLGDNPDEVLTVIARDGYRPE